MELGSIIAFLFHIRNREAIPISLIRYDFRTHEFDSDNTSNVTRTSVKIYGSSLGSSIDAADEVMTTRLTLDLVFEVSRICIVFLKPDKTSSPITKDRIENSYGARYSRTDRFRWPKLLQCDRRRYVQDTSHVLVQFDRFIEGIRL